MPQVYDYGGGGARAHEDHRFNPQEHLQVGRGKIQSQYIHEVNRSHCFTHQIGRRVPDHSPPLFLLQLELEKEKRKEGGEA